MLNNTINLIGAIVLVAYAIVAIALGPLQWLEKYPTIKKFIEAKAVRAVLLFVAIVLLFGVFQNINAVREALDVPPHAPKAPPVPEFVLRGDLNAPNNGSASSGGASKSSDSVNNRVNQQGNGDTSIIGSGNTVSK